MRPIILLMLVLGTIVCLSSHLLCWEVLGILCFVPIVGLIFVVCCAVYCMASGQNENLEGWK